MRKIFHLEIKAESSHKYYGSLKTIPPVRISLLSGDKLLSIKKYSYEKS